MVTIPSVAAPTPDAISALVADIQSGALPFPLQKTAAEVIGLPGIRRDIAPARS